MMSPTLQTSLRYVAIDPFPWAELTHSQPSGWRQGPQVQKGAPWPSEVPEVSSGRASLHAEEGNVSAGVLHTRSSREGKPQICLSTWHLCPLSSAQSPCG